MAVQWSTAVRNALLDAWETAIGVSPKLRLYAGTMPLNAAAALSANTLLAEFALASDWATAAAGGSKSLSGMPLTTAGQAGAGAGTNASFYRFYDTAGAVCHEQGTITITAGGGDMTVDNVSIANGQMVNITGFTKTAPGA